MGLGFFLLFFFLIFKSKLDYANAYVFYFRNTDHASTGLCTDPFCWWIMQSTLKKLKQTRKKPNQKNLTITSYVSHALNTTHTYVFNSSCSRLPSLFYTKKQLLLLAVIRTSKTIIMVLLNI